MARSACSFRLGKKSVLQGVEWNSLPFWLSNWAISSVRSGWSWHMRERDFLPWMIWETVA